MLRRHNGGFWIASLIAHTRTSALPLAGRRIGSIATESGLDWQFVTDWHSPSMRYSGIVKTGRLCAVFLMSTTQCRRSLFHVYSLLLLLLLLSWTTRLTTQPARQEEHHASFLLCELLIQYWHITLLESLHSLFYYWE